MHKGGNSFHRTTYLHKIMAIFKVLKSKHSITQIKVNMLQPPRDELFPCRLLQENKKTLNSHVGQNCLIKPECANYITIIRKKTKRLPLDNLCTPNTQQCYKYFTSLSRTRIPNNIRNYFSVLICLQWILLYQLIENLTRVNVIPIVESKLLH